MMVPDRWPVRNACMAVTISAGARPTNRATGVSTERDAGWQPEHEDAPGGASAAIAPPSGSQAPPSGSQSPTSQTAVRFETMRAPRKYLKSERSGSCPPLLIAQTDRRSVLFNGTERMRLPVAAAIALRTAGAATAMVGSPTPPTNPPDGITITSTCGISAMRITL
jgi:hypothetical protein